MHSQWQTDIEFVHFTRCQRMNPISLWWNHFYTENCAMQKFIWSNARNDNPHKCQFHGKGSNPLWFRCDFSQENPVKNTCNSRIVEMHTICEWNIENSQPKLFINLWQKWCQHLTSFKSRAYNIVLASDTFSNDLLWLVSLSLLNNSNSHQHQYQHQYHRHLCHHRCYRFCPPNTINCTSHFSYHHSSYW